MTTTHRPAAATIVIALALLALAARGVDAGQTQIPTNLQRTRGQTLSYIVKDLTQDSAVKLHLTTLQAVGDQMSTSLTMDSIAGYDLSHSQLLFITDSSNRVSSLMAPRGQPDDHTELLLFALRFLRGEQRGATQIAHAMVDSAGQPGHKIVERELRVADATQQIISVVDQATATLLSSKIKLTYKSSIAPDTVLTVELFNNATLSEKTMTSKFPESLHFVIYGHYEEDVRPTFSGRPHETPACGLHDEEHTSMSCLWGCRATHRRVRCCHRVFKFQETCHVFVGRFVGHQHDSMIEGVSLSKWTPCHQVALRLQHEGRLSELSFDGQHYRGMADLCL